jgi:tRNA-uridine 2-sulfurtransferase
VAWAPRIAVAMSGGIDSAVTAMVLKEQGYSCVGVFMRNWDNADEHGESRCSISKDFEDMKIVCKALDIEAVEVEFIKEYWNNVFEPFLEDYRSGATPNPDVMCNKYIKFHYFKEFIKRKLDIDHMATGHYANVSCVPMVAADASVGESLTQVTVLMRGVDRLKDQSYFLAMTNVRYHLCVMLCMG